MDISLPFQGRVAGRPGGVVYYFNSEVQAGQRVARLAIAVVQNGHSFVFGVLVGLRRNRLNCLIIRNTDNDTIKKFIVAFRNAPYFISAPNRTTIKFAKSTRPIKISKTGLNISCTSEFTIWVKAAPITTPMAKSNALPLMANSLNSFHIFIMRVLYCMASGFGNFFCRV